MAWPGVIEHYRSYLPVSDATPVVTLREGDTPLIPAPRLGRELGLDLHLKFEGANPTGSFKDRGMTMAMSKALEGGARAVMCASTGNTSAAAAADPAPAGRPGDGISPARARLSIRSRALAQALAYGAKVLQIAGNFDDALAQVRRLTDEYQEIALVNSVNPYRLQGQKTGAFEVCDQLGAAPDYLAIPVGNAGNVSAYWMGFKEYNRGRPVCLGFQAAGSAPLVLGKRVDDPHTVATAIKIGNPASWTLAEAAIAESGGRFEAVTDEEILSAYRWVAACEGILAEPASCAPLAGLRKLVSERPGLLPRGARVVAVLTGHGLKDPDIAIKQSSAPIKVPNQYEAVLDTVLGREAVKR